MVQLKQLERENIKFRLNRFQFHKFQFHNGTIKTHFISGKSVCLPNFNSIKVQLKQILMICRDCLIQFQFHNGTIKIFAKYFTSEHAICRFQFQYGTIKTQIFCRYRNIQIISIP